MVVMFGAEDGVRHLREASAWSADGTFKVAPSLWAQLYTAHAVTQGYVLPCVYALLPDKTGAAYQGVWSKVRG